MRKIYERVNELDISELFVKQHRNIII